MTLPDWYQFKLFVEHASGVSMDAWHILAGFILFIGATVLTRRGMASFVPWTALLLLELVNEAYDLRVEVWPSLSSQIGEGAKDISLTMVLPTIILAIARWKPHWLLGKVR